MNWSSTIDLRGRRLGNTSQHNGVASAPQHKTPRPSTSRPAPRRQASSFPARARPRTAGRSKGGIVRRALVRRPSAHPADGPARTRSRERAVSEAASMPCATARSRRSRHRARSSRRHYRPRPSSEGRRAACAAGRKVGVEGVRRMRRWVEAQLQGVARVRAPPGTHQEPVGWNRDPGSGVLEDGRRVPFETVDVR